MSEKLTGPQRALLKDLVESGPRYVSDTYQPGRRLVELGYAEEQRLHYSAKLAATDAGRAALPKTPSHE